MQRLVYVAWGRVPCKDVSRHCPPAAQRSPGRGPDSVPWYLLLRSEGQPGDSLRRCRLRSARLGAADRNRARWKGMRCRSHTANARRVSSGAESAIKAAYNAKMPRQTRYEALGTMVRGDHPHSTEYLLKLVLAPDRSTSSTVLSLVFSHFCGNGTDAHALGFPRPHRGYT